MSPVNILLIGLGHHAKRIYTDFNKDIPDARLVGVVDLSSQKQSILAYLKESHIDVPSFFVESEKISDKLDRRDKAALNQFVAKLNCDAVIISTEPLSHFKYVTWALDHGFHILLDKPITTEVNVSTKISKARKLLRDYKKISKKYRSSLNKKNIVFVLQAQRRFHRGFLFAKERIEEIYERTSCPVTSIQSLHSDGQWRLPDEIVELDYHSYNQNYGKMSHSGYHSLDIALWMSDLKLPSHKKYSSFEVYSKFNRPFDYLQQITPADYSKFLSNPVIRTSAKSYRSKHRVEGEIDAFNSISLKNSAGALITHISASMIHNGFSQRGWYIPNLKNLYKGNGRVRHESYIIEQGPFQCIVINSFQSHELLKDTGHRNVGGENHFDVHVFRNSTLFQDLKSHNLYQIEELSENEKSSQARGHNEKARKACIKEFIDAIQQNRPPEKQKSNFFDHQLATVLLAAIYESAVRDLTNKSAIIKGNL